MQRNSYLDYIAVKRVDAAGQVTGEYRFLGLYTHLAFTESITAIPVARRKLEGVLAYLGLAEDSHDGTYVAEVLEFYPRESHARFVAGVQPIAGEWFPDAFLGSMLSVQRFALGEADAMPTRVEDALDTMRVVEAAYLSSERGGEPLPVARMKAAQ